VFFIAEPSKFAKCGKVKDAIIVLLSHRWPLSSKTIYLAVIKEYGLNVSYQAVHKALFKLVEDKVICKEECKYRLDNKWIQQMKAYGKNLENVYEKNSPKQKLNQLIEAVSR
jgi:predicted transcriptional regulator